MRLMMSVTDSSSRRVQTFQEQQRGSRLTDQFSWTQFLPILWWPPRQLPRTSCKVDKQQCNFKLAIPAIPHSFIPISQPSPASHFHASFSTNAWAAEWSLSFLHCRHKSALRLVWRLLQLTLWVYTNTNIFEALMPPYQLFSSKISPVSPCFTLPRWLSLPTLGLKMS